MMRKIYEETNETQFGQRFLKSLQCLTEDFKRKVLSILISYLNCPVNATIRYYVLI